LNSGLVRQVLYYLNHSSSPRYIFKYIFCKVFVSFAGPHCRALL
jgi:hypothetical protein